MSEIFVDTIKNKAGSTSLDSDKLPDMYSGSAKQWTHLNGQGTIAIKSSFNTSSSTDLGTGYYQHNFTSGYTSVFDYVMSAGTTDIQWGGKTVETGSSGFLRNANYLRTSSFRGDQLTSSGIDPEIVNVITHGDLA